MTNVFSPEKAAWHLDKVADLRKGLDIVPPHIQIIISDLCNQDCHFCAYRMEGGFSTENFALDGNRNPKRFIPTRKVLEILDDCKELGVSAIEFTGGGEPTVHPDHLEIISHAQMLGLQTGLVTNGVLLKDHSAFRSLDWLRVSLDAGTAESYEAIRKSRAWPKVVENLSMISQFEKPLVGVGFVVTQENYTEIRDACFIVKLAGIPYVRVSAMFSDEGDAYYRDCRDAIRELLDSAKLELEDEAFKIVDFFDDRVQDLAQGAPDYDFCGYQQFNLYIGGDQKVYTCCTNAYTTLGEIGDLHQQRFKDWLKSYRRFDWNSRVCHHCQFNDKNRFINFLLDPDPKHVNFV